MSKILIFPIFLIIASFVGCTTGQVVYSAYQNVEYIEAEVVNPGDEFEITVEILGRTVPAQVDEEVEKRPMIALTFDDGPSAYTNHILDLLYENGGRATFFVLGSRVESRRDIILRMHSLGNEVANHSWSHRNLARANRDTIYQEIRSTSDAISSIIGYSAPLLRPPYGSTNSRVREVAAEFGYPIVNWHIDPMDWRYRDPYRIYNVIISQAEAGAIILLHDIHGTTATAMEMVIPRLIEEGFDLVTVSEVLAYRYGEIVPGRIYGMGFERNYR